MTTTRTHWWQRDMAPIEPEASGSIDKALASAGLDFDVGMRDVYASNDRQGWTWAENHQAIVRNDTEAILGIVSDRYAPVQHREALSFVTEICENFDAEIDRIWSLKGGAKIRAMVSYKRDVDIAGIDTIRPWLLFTTSHDGTESVAMTVVPTQISCLNQIPMLRRHHGAHRIVHSGRTNERLRSATEAIVAADRSLDLLSMELEYLLGEQIDGFSAGDMIEQAVCGFRGSAKAREDDMASIRSLMDTRPTLPKSAEDSKFAVLHAVTEHYSHIREYRSRAAHERDMTNARASQVCRRTFELLTA